MKEVLFIIDPKGDIYESSSFTPNSFKITNNSTTQNITSVSLDLSTAIFPDIVYDPNGTAGDTSSKDLEIDTPPATVGYVSRSFSPERDGGHDILNLNFNDFQPGETVEFSIDTDSTSTKGAEQSTSKHFGSVSGLELVGATATVTFADNTSLQGQFYRIPDSVTGSQVLLTSTTIPAPTIEAVGLDTTAASVTDANQTIKVTGTPNSQVSLLIVEGAYLTEDGVGFDPDPFEANVAIAVNEITATIGANGTVDIPVTLTSTNAPSGELGGLNYITAKYQDGNDTTSGVSSPLVLELDSAAVSNPGDIPTATLVASELIDFTQPYSFNVTYTDDVGMKADTINFNDVTVTAPDGVTVLPVTFVGVEDVNGDQKVMTATYSVAAPGGNWANGRGTYTVETNAEKVADTTGNNVAAGVLGNFIANVPHNPAATGEIRIEAEDYKAGTLDVEYFDFNPTNLSGAYRPNEAVDIEVTGDVGGGFNVAFVEAGEHLTYDVNVVEAGNYELVLRVATPATEVQSIGVTVGGQTYSASFGSTGDYQVYQDIVLPNVNLNAGIQELRLDLQTSEFNLNYIQLAPKAPVVDETAPLAQLDTTSLTQQTNSPAAAIFDVTFTDNIALKSTTIDANDVTVTAPDGTVLPVTLVGVNAIGDGSPRIATYSVAAPGGKWDNADKGNYTVALKAEAVSDTSNNAIAAGSLGSFTIDVTGGQTTTGNTIRIEAEDYKTGNNGIEYFDTSRGNFGGALHGDDIDIEATGDVDGGHNLAWIEAGEYLTYDVNITTPGNYDLVLRVATASEDAKSVEVVIGGSSYTASFSNTGGWQTYQDITIPNVNLSAGSQEVRLNMKSNSFNLNYFELVAKTDVQPPSPTGTTRIEAEDYKAGTNDVEYFDFDPENLGGAYRPNEPVDIEVTGDTGGGFNVAFIEAGEHLTYDVNIAEAGNYNLVLRVANPDEFNKTVDVVIGGQTYTASIGSTGGYQTYTDVVINNVNLVAGIQELRLDMQSKDFNLNYLELAPAEPIVDATAPIAKLENTPDNSDIVVLNQLTSSTSTANFSVTFSDNLGIDVATIDASDLTVTAPNGTVIPVTLTGVNATGNGSPRTAVYSIAAPGGTWNAADIGDYTVAIKAAAVSDINGKKVAAKTIGKLAVGVSNPASDGVIRINAGATTDTVDSSGKLWQTDANFVGGLANATVYNPIDNTKDDFIYQSQRSGTNFNYSIPVADGNYNVSLYLSELEFTDFGLRVFDVSQEGDLALNDLDVYRLTNNAFLDGENDANMVKIPNLAIVRDGALNLDFTSVVDQASLAGIVISPVEGAQVLIEESQQNTSVAEGGNTDTYQVLLNTKPTANVTINLQLDGQTTTDKTSLVFTPQNWSTPQTVTVSAVDDAEGESFHTSTIGHTISTTSPAYSGLTVPSVSAKITDNDSAEIKFKPQIEIDKIDSGFYGTTAGDWGPDGRLYVALADGQIKAYTFDDNYNVLDTQTITTIQGLSNLNITGIAFNPFENTGGQPKIYVAHNQFYANPDAYEKEGGFDELTDFSPYSGQVSVLEGPDFATLTPIVENIGVSNHDHGINGLAFDENGDLLIASGSNTNAGIIDDAIGGTDESPFTAAILKAEITKPGFNGNIQYQLPDDFVPPEGLNLIKPDGTPATPEESQGFGGLVEVVPGVDVTVYAPGFRNAYDLVYASNGIVYATENDANTSFGDESLSATEQRPFTLDPLNELNIVEQGNYYGQPNRSRGIDDPRQNVYVPSQTPSNADYTAPIEEFDSPIQGITEYRSNAFGGQLRGNLLTQEYNGSLHNVQLSEDGRGTVNKNILEVEVVSDQGELVKTSPFYTKFFSDELGKDVFENKGLDVLTGFSGAIIGINESDSRVTVVVPDDDQITNMVAYEISDWRAPAIGGGQFTIGGINFSGILADTTVAIGGKTATITSVTEKRIVGTFPAFELTDPIIGSTEYTEDKLLDITVASGGEESVITDTFQPLFV